VAIQLAILLADFAAKLALVALFWAVVLGAIWALGFWPSWMPWP
jgi:hypothetical protein